MRLVLMPKPQRVWGFSTFGLTGAATPEAARAALEAASAPAESAAAQAFVGYLHQASAHVTRPVRRGRAARMH